MSEKNAQLPWGTAVLGMWLPQSKGLGHCSGVMLNVSAPSPRCCERAGDTWVA